MPAKGGLASPSAVPVLLPAPAAGKTLKVRKEDLPKAEGSDKGIIISLPDHGFKLFERTVRRSTYPIPVQDAIIDAHENGTPLDEKVCHPAGWSCQG